MSNDYEAPTGDESAQSDEVASTQGFQKPPAQTDEGAQAAYVPDASSLTGGFSTQLIDAHGEIASALKDQDRSGGAQSYEFGSYADGLTNIEAVAIGLGEPADGPPGEPVLTVFVGSGESSKDVKAAVVDGLGAQSAADLPVAVRVSGQFEAQAQTHRIRPCPAGMSVGHVKVTAGTFGALSVGRSAPRNSRLMILSNNHVLANSNNAVYGDSIIQPGRVDGGTHPADQIAILERFVPIRFGQGNTNYVDAATAWAWPDRVRREQAYRSGSGYSLYRTGSVPEYPALGDTVGKSGRTTELTQGRVTALNWSGWINYGAPGQAFFSGQFVVQANSGNFSAGGDSGSVIWKWRNGVPPTGLLFAGGGGYTIANPLPWVTYYLDVNLYT
ncbi:hypothetical protein [Rhodococcus koreensis]